MSRSDLPAETLAACGGSVLRLWHRPNFEGATVSHSAGVQFVSWNRNNKVVATGCQDGTIQLCYSHGQAMSVLRAEGSEQLGSLGSMDWSMGSKFLAAGSSNGGIYVWDLKMSKKYTALARHAGHITSVRYHPEDKFLAVASSGDDGGVALYDFQGHEQATLRCADGSVKFSLQAAASEPALACGSEAGSVVVWDWTTRQARELYQGQHKDAVHAVSFVPLEPSMLYSAGLDGRLVLQDRRAGPAFANRLEVGVPLSALSVREDYTSVAVGTQDGSVLLFDPRQLSSPLHRLDCCKGQPVTGLHWQHCYTSLSRSRGATSLKAKAPASTSAAGAGPATGGPDPANAPSAVAPAAAAGSRIPQAALAAQATAGNPTYSAMRRHSGIGTGAAPPPRQPSPEVAAAAPPGRSPALQLNPLINHGGARAAQEGQLTLSHKATDAGTWSPTNWPPQPPMQAALSPLQQQPPQRTPAAAGFGAGGELGRLAITPLSGMAPGCMPAAATPGHVTPTQQQLPQRQSALAAASMPLVPSAAAPTQSRLPAAVEATPAGQQHFAAAGSGAAAIDFAITPLSSMAVRPTARNVGAATTTPPPTTVPQPAAGVASAAAALSITPLSSMRPGRGTGQPAGPSAAAATGAVLQENTNQPHVVLQQQLSSLRQQERQVLQHPPAPLRRSPSQAPSANSPGSRGQQSPPSLAAQQQQQQPLQSPTLAENLPPPPGSIVSAGSGKEQGQARLAGPKQQQQGGEVMAVAVEDSAVNSYTAKLAQKEALARQAGAAAGAQEEGAGEQWLVKAAMGGEQREDDAAMLDAPAPAPMEAAASPGFSPPPQLLSGGSSLSSVPSSPSSPGFSFQAVAAQQQQQHGSSSDQGQRTPDAKLGQRSRDPSLPPGSAVPAAPAAAPAAIEPAPAYPNGQHGLREDILALHLDVLNQFQVQQEQMTSLVQHVVERQDALAAEVKALRRQLQGLMQTRNEFLWL